MSNRKLFSCHLIKEESFVGLTPEHQNKQIPGRNNFIGNKIKRNCFQNIRVKCNFDNYVIGYMRMYILTHHVPARVYYILLHF